MLTRLFNDEAGFLISAELVLIFTLVFCAVAVGVAMVKDAVATEFSDVAEAIGALNQSYNFRSLQAEASMGSTDHATCTGSGFVDEADDCDCVGLLFPTVAGKNDPSVFTALEGN